MERVSDLGVASVRYWDVYLYVYDGAHRARSRGHYGGLRSGDRAAVLFVPGVGSPVTRGACPARYCRSRRGGAAGPGSGQVGPLHCQSLPFRVAPVPDPPPLVGRRTCGHTWARAYLQPRRGEREEPSRASAKGRVT